LQSSDGKQTGDKPVNFYSFCIYPLLFSNGNGWTFVYTRGVNTISGRLNPLEYFRKHEKACMHACTDLETVCLVYFVLTLALVFEVRNPTQALVTYAVIESQMKRRRHKRRENVKCLKEIYATDVIRRDEARKQINERQDAARWKSSDKWLKE